MISNYFKIALRNLLKYKGYSFINIFGLTTGMAVAMLIGLWICDEWSYGHQLKNHGSMVKILQNQTFNGEVQTSGTTPKQLEPELRKSYGSDFKYLVIAGQSSDHLFGVGDKKITKMGNFMGSEISEMLDLEMLEGSRKGLSDPNSVLISESTSKAIFGGNQALNKIIKLDNRWDMKISGVYRDIPKNSSFGELAFIAPWELLEKDLPEWLGWGNNWFQLYGQLADNADMDKVSAKIKDVKFIAAGPEEKKYKSELFVYPLSDLYLKGEFKNGVAVGGKIQNIWLFGVIGIFVLVLACINFMNLSTARSEKRAKEVGIRKAIGSVKSQLIVQFFSESILVVSLSFILTIILVQLSLGIFNEVVGKEIHILWANPYFWLGSSGFVLFTGLIAGSYPALYLSSFQPVKVLKGTFRAGRFAAVPRQALVVVQFTVSVTLIAGTLIVFRQIQFAKNRPVGYNRDGLIRVPLKNDEIISHFATLRQDLLNTGMVDEVAATDSPVTDTYVTNGGFDWKGKDPDMADEFTTLRVTHEFGKTIGWKIKEGRDFSKEFSSDSMGFILNEAAVKYMGLKKPIDHLIKWGDNGEYKVIGVVKDMVSSSPYDEAKQTIFFINYKRINFLNIKMIPGKSTEQALSKIEQVFKKHDPANPFEYKFADQEYARKFADEEKVAKLSGFFAILAAFISCLGLFGLASFVAEQRTKEIGIRKVLGASVNNLWQLLSKDFALLVGISCLIAIPVAWYFMNGWLQNYTYRTKISWEIFAIVAGGALVVTLLTVSYQTLKAALKDPVKSLKSE